MTTETSLRGVGKRSKSGTTQRMREVGRDERHGGVERTEQMDKQQPSRMTIPAFRNPTRRIHPAVRNPTRRIRPAFRNPTRRIRSTFRNPTRSWSVCCAPLCWSLPSRYRSAGYCSSSRCSATAAQDEPESNHTSIVSVPLTHWSACGNARIALHSDHTMDHAGSGPTVRAGCGQKRLWRGGRELDGAATT